MSNKVKIPCGGFVLGEGLALGEDGKTLNVTGGGSKQVVYDLSKAVFKEEESFYYFVDPTTLTDILKSINTGSPMPYIGLKVIGQPPSQPEFLVNVCINFGWGISMNAEAVTVLGMTSTTGSVHVHIFDTFEHAKAYYER